MIADVTSSHLFNEIHEQPDVLSNLLSTARPSIEALAQAIREQDIQYVVIAARGTSDNAGRYAQYVLGGINRIMVALSTPSLFTHYRQPPMFGRALVLGISQSGQSPDIVAVLAEAQRQGALTATLTNHPDSPLGDASDFVIDLAAGTEKAVAATKTYTAELGAIAMLSAYLSADSEQMAQLDGIPAAVAETLELNTEVADIAPRYRYMQRAVAIGRGYNYSTAFEMALKTKELAYVLVAPYSSADFLHGPLAMVEDGFPIFLIAPSGALDEEMQRFVEEVVPYQPELICISNQPDLLSKTEIALHLPTDLPEWLSPISAIVPGQLLALHLAAARGYNVDAPRSIRKVTETR